MAIFLQGASVERVSFFCSGEDKRKRSCTDFSRRYFSSVSSKKLQSYCRSTTRKLSLDHFFPILSSIQELWMQEFFYDAREGSSFLYERKVSCLVKKFRPCWKQGRTSCSGIIGLPFVRCEGITFNILRQSFMTLIFFLKYPRCAHFEPKNSRQR